MIKKMITICIPVYNEEENIPLAHRELSRIFEKLPHYQAEFLFTDNASTDRSFELLKQLAARDSRVRAVRFSRNFGYQNSTLTNLLMAKGDAAIQFDCDLQDPPELILEFIAQWERGHKVVHGVRVKRDEGRLIEWCRKFYYRLLNRIGEEKIPVDVGDFRLIDRVVIEEMRKIHDTQPYVRGIISWIGYPQLGIPYERRRRELGESKFNFVRLVKLASDGIFSFSVVPLQIASFVGFFFSILTFLGSIAYLIGKFLFGLKWPEGFATTTILILASISLNGIFFGVLGTYIGRIYNQVRRRPYAIVDTIVQSPSSLNEKESLNGQASF